MEQQDLLEVTMLIDDCNYNKEPIITVDMLHERLWNGLNKLRLATNKDELIEEWKYKSDLISTEKSHENNNKDFDKVGWEHSFVLSFWMGIYH
jgi:hypothetical protein